MSNISATHSRPALSAPDAGLLQEASLSIVRAVACFPFDAIRAAHATAVQHRLAPRSILASADVERLVHALEGVMLGPVARRR